MKRPKQHAAARWSSPRTICGVEWVDDVFCALVGTERQDDAILTCKRCIRITGRKK